MGTDGHIFDAESKECLDFDRFSNLQVGVDWAGETGEIMAKIEAGRPPRKYCTADEVMKLAKAALDYWGEDRHAYWARCVYRFAEDRPRGRFFIAHDHSLFATDGEIIDEEDYTVVEA